MSDNAAPAAATTGTTPAASEPAAGGTSPVAVSTSDPATSSEPGNTAPTSNQDVVKAAIASMENPEPAAEAVPAGEVKPAAPAPEADPFGLGELQYVDAAGVTRDHRIPKSRVKEMLGKAVDSVHGSVKSAFGLRDDVAVTPDVLKQVGQDFRALRTEAASFTQAANLMMSDEAAFVDRMIAANPKYDAYLKQRFGGGAAAPAAGGGAPAAGMPQPNVRLADGSMTYDLAGLQSLLEWNTQHTTEQVTSKLTGVVDQRLKPYEEKERARLANHELEQKLDTMLADAMTWPGFKENQPAIVAWLSQPGNEARSLNQAYMAVLGPKWSTDRQKLREEVMAEIAAAPRGTATPANAGVSGRIPEAGNKNLTNAEIVAGVIAGKLK